LYPSLFLNILSICYKHNTTQESADNERLYSIAGAKMERLWVQVGWGCWRRWRGILTLLTLIDRSATVER